MTPICPHTLSNRSIIFRENVRLRVFNRSEDSRLLVAMDGRVVLAGAPCEVSPTFVPALVDAAVFWQLLARDLARNGGPFASLPSRRIERHLGDVAAGGKAELIMPV